MSRLGDLKDAAVAALDYIDRTCDAFLENEDDECAPPPASTDSFASSSVADAADCADSEATLASLVFRGSSRGEEAEQSTEPKPMLTKAVDRHVARLHRLRSQASKADDDWVYVCLLLHTFG